MEKRKNGFTLIELIAIVVIIAIIALITVPQIIKIIENGKKNTFLDSVNGIVRVVKLDNSNNDFESGEYEIKNGVVINSLGNTIKSEGGSDEEGTLSIDQNGNLEYVIHNSKWCVIESEGVKSVLKYEEGSCKVPEPIAQVIVNEVGKETEGYEGCTGTGKLVKVEHTNVSEEESKVSYRYQGKCPNNYVTFNGEEAGWRIIGIIDGKLKLIRDESIGNFSWDNKDTTTGAESTYGKNEWTEARLMKLLNPTYEDEEVGGSLYWNRKSGNCYAGQNNGIKTCDFRSTGLTVEAQNMIDQNSKWYLGGWNTSDITKDEMYEKERGTTTYNDSRETEWTGAIGLIYPSDYGYAAGESCTQTLYGYRTCSNVNWMYNSSRDEWTILPFSSYSYSVFYRNQNGYIGSGSYDVYDAIGVRPTFYLKSNVKIKGGDGTPSNPYILS